MQQGLESLKRDGLINTSQPAVVQEEALRRTRVFYFNSITGSKLSVEEASKYELLYRHADQNQKVSSQQVGPMDEMRVLTLVELQELIETGKMDQIPHNKVVSDALNEDPPSESTASVRKKPWEDVQVQGV